MNTQHLPQNTFGNNGAKAQRSIPGSFATGKGTTARIVTFLENARGIKFTAKQIADGLNLPARQLSKRLRELERSAKVSATIWADRPNEFYIN
jgi:hypothetical protein